jgi:hypothetical protein
LRNFDRERRETERNGGILLCERESGMDLYEREGIGNFKGREDIYIYIYIYLKKMLNVGRRKLLKILILTRLGNYNTNSDRKIVRNFKIH